MKICYISMEAIMAIDNNIVDKNHIWVFLLQTCTQVDLLCIPHMVVVFQMSFRQRICQEATKKKYFEDKAK